MKKYLLLIPALILCGQFFWLLAPLSDNNRKALTVPNFSLPALIDPEQTITHSDIKFQNIRIINFFASWCGPCKIEHPLLMELKKNNHPILGINYQDTRESALLFLENTGNPYQLSAWDKKGMTGLSWGIMSIPQTYVIDANGLILYHKSGRLLPQDIDKHILPLLETSTD